ncbi:hypothetical protein EV702DRAFT_1044493 [Suillus placidus]|uniref:Uncharacterized protein n=1 Tax=Suillus placidus TaxID=48579 RepID=A0A9P6ZYT9_9AGAM|nr:hypothetical protein EV702DRAFT_1044493 [Suillus placidus]
MTLSECDLIAFIPYQIQGYSVRQDFLYRNYFPLLAVFLLWSDFGSPYAVNIIKMMLEEHFRCDKSRLRITTHVLKAGNNYPEAMTPSFEWMKHFNYEGNLLIYVNTHSDTETGFLVITGNAENPQSAPINELLLNYIGDSNLRNVSHVNSAINKSSGAGPCYCGLVIC